MQIKGGNLTSTDLKLFFFLSIIRMAWRSILYLKKKKMLFGYQYFSYSVRSPNPPKKKFVGFDTTTVTQYKVFRCMSCFFGCQFTNIHWAVLKRNIYKLQSIINNFPDKSRIKNTILVLYEQRQHSYTKEFAYVLNQHCFKYTMYSGYTASSLHTQL